MHGELIHFDTCIYLLYFLSDGTVAWPQGCWHNTVTNEGLDVAKGLVTNSPYGCIDKCANYKYAGIRVSLN